jgi:branched-chain amino acid transport system substrate-binding protein
MQEPVRWTAILAVMLLVLTACGPLGSPSVGAGASADASAGPSEDIAAICNADSFGCVEIAATDPIRLASALAISGDIAYRGIDSNVGIEVAIEDRGQILGREIELVKEDAGCEEAADSQRAAEAIVADPTVVGVIGTSCSPGAQSAVQVLAAEGLVMISPSNSSPSLTNPDSAGFAGPFHFRTANNELVQGEAVATFACQELAGIETAATIHDGTADAEQVEQAFVDKFEALCGSVTVRQAIDVGDQDLSELLATIGSNSPDLLFLSTSSAEGSVVARQSQDVAGLADTVLVGTERLKERAFVADAGDPAEEIGMYFAGPDLNFGTTYTDGFLPKYLAISGGDDPPAPYHAHAYDAADILLDAILAVGLQDAEGTLWIPRDAIRVFVAALADFPGLTGTLTCAETGDCGSEFVSIAKLEGGAFTEVYTTRP